MADLTPTAGLIALGIAMAEAIKWLARSLAHKQGENGASGQKSASWWELKIGEIVENKLEAHEAKLREIIRQEMERKIR